MNIIFHDNGLHKRLAPITLTRPVAEIRFGIKTLSERWVGLLKQEISINEISYKTENYLEEKFNSELNGPCLNIAGNIKATKELAGLVASLAENEQLIINGRWVASFGENANKNIEYDLPKLLRTENIWDLFQNLEQAIQMDFDEITEGRTSEILSNTNQISGIQNIFLEEGAKVEFAILNAENGPIYIGKNAEIMEGSIIRGPFSLGESSTVKMGAKIYGPTSIGPHCKVGGEISNCLFQAFSNKGHDGFLGNSIIGEWCNLGADTNSSNLKNNYGKVSIYSYETMEMEKTDEMFCGVLMGDHSKTGINTMLNTATVVGVSANVFGGGFPSKFIPSFTWGGIDRNEKFNLDKAFEVAQNMMKRRNIDFTEKDKNIFKYIFNSLA